MQKHAKASNVCKGMQTVKNYATFLKKYGQGSQYSLKYQKLQKIQRSTWQYIKVHISKKGPKNM